MVPSSKMDSLQTSQPTPVSQAADVSLLDKIPADQMTIIVTTSPVPSSPSPVLVQNTLESLPPALKDLPIVITFDSFKIAPEEKARLKRGKIPESLAESYPEYIENVKRLFPGYSSEEKEIEGECYFKSYATGVTFLRMKTRQGFAFGVKEALDYVKTPYVLILQHDWLFTAPFPPITTLFSIMKNEPEDVKYITFVSRHSMDYVHSRSHVFNFKYTFDEAVAMRKGRALETELQACLHWFDRPHFCSIELYRKIFALDILKRGDFIEDTFGTKYMNSICNALTRQGAFSEWKKFGAWMYYPNNGKDTALKHGSGRTNLLGTRQEELIEHYKKTSCKRDKKKELAEKYGEQFVAERYGVAGLKKENNNENSDEEQNDS